MARIEITRAADGSLVANTIDYLGDAFGAYNAACKTHGFRWNKERGRASRNIGTIDGLPGLMLDLADGGIEVVLDADTRRELQVLAMRETDTSILDGHFASIDPFPNGKKPYEYQREGIAFLRERDRVLLGDDMGLGKTIQLLLALDARQPALVIAPASILLKWAREAREWRPSHNVAVVLKSATKRQRGALNDRGIEVLDAMRWPNENEIVICNYESMGAWEYVETVKDGSGRVSQRLVRRADSPADVPVDTWVNQTLFASPAPRTVLCGDELHRAKNPKAKVTYRWNSLKRAVLDTGGKVVGMSGTPLFNRPPDLWNVLRDLDLNTTVFAGWGDFVRRMGGGQGRYGLEWSGTVDASVARSLRRVMLRRMRDDVLDLPAWTHETIEVDLSEKVARFFDEIERRVGDLSIPQGDDLDAIERAVHEALASAKSKIGFEDFSRVRRLISEANLPAAIEVIEEYEAAEKPLVVFSAHRAPVEAIAKREGWAAIMGSISKQERDEIQQAFLRGALKGVACVIEAAKEGLDLYAADTVLFIDRSWNPSDNEQAASRIRRIGQTSQTCLNITLLPDHKLVRRMTELLCWKERMVAQTLDGATTRSSRALEDKNEAETALRLAQANSKRKPEEKVVIGDTLLDRIPAGSYAVANENGAINEHSFYQIDKPEDGRWEGWVFVKILRGPDAGRLFSRSPEGDVRGNKRVGAAVIRKIAADVQGAMLLYGKLIGFCGHCGRRLTNDESREYGIGPICRAKMGW